MKRSELAREAAIRLAQHDEEDRTRVGWQEERDYLEAVAKALGPVYIVVWYAYSDTRVINVWANKAHAEEEAKRLNKEALIEAMKGYTYVLADGIKRHVAGYPPQSTYDVEEHEVR